MFAKSFVDHGSSGSGGDKSRSPSLAAAADGFASGADLPLFFDFFPSSSSFISGSGDILEKKDAAGKIIRSRLRVDSTHLFLDFAVAPFRLCLENFFLDSG